MQNRVEAMQVAMNATTRKEMLYKCRFIRRPRAHPAGQHTHERISTQTHVLYAYTHAFTGVVVRLGLAESPRIPTLSSSFQGGVGRENKSR